MPNNYDNSDVLWTSRGDICIDEFGDVMDTEYDPLRSLVQEIRTRLEASMGDWKVYTNIGANLEDFVGQLNNKTTAEGVKLRVKDSLTKDGFIAPQDINIMYMPVTRDQLLVRLTVKVRKTVRNGNSESLTMGLLYQYSENNIYFL
jgi:hypothetical protein